MLRMSADSKHSNNNDHPVPIVPDDQDKGKGQALAVGIAKESTLPLGQSLTLAVIYMVGCIVQFLLIRWSKERAKAGNGITYDDASAVFFTEFLKWAFSVGAMYYRTNKFLPISVFQDGTWRIGLYYAVPSFIYAIYNNFTFINLRLFDPSTYQVFMQTRVLFTGLLYSWVLQKHLTSRKWLALMVLTSGVVLKHLTFPLHLDVYILFLFFQASLSAFAGVYNEYLLKKDITMDVNEQNFFMYSFALIFNLGYGLMSNPTYYSSGQVFVSLNSVLLLIVINGAIIGIVTSLILKFINVIVKAFASACEVMLTAIAAWALLGTDLTIKDLIACSIVMYSIYMYYTMPGQPITAAATGASVPPTDKREGTANPEGKTT
jgi:drug/metabolite transporter (DMT)-like permease